MKEFDRNDFEPGAWNVICDRCGCKFKNHKLRKEYTGLMVCSGQDTNDCWEPRPLTGSFVNRRIHRPHVYSPRVPFVSSEGEPQFVNPYPACPIWGVRAYAGLAIAGCAIAGLHDIAPDILAGMRGN